MWDKQIDEYKPEIMMGVGGVIVFIFLVIMIEDWLRARKARKHQQKLRNSVGLDNKNRGW